MEWSLSTLIPSFALLVYGGIFLVVAFTRPSTPARRDFRLYLATMFVWSLAALLTLSGLGNVTFWFRMMTAGAVASLLGLFHFVQTFTGKRFSWAPWVYLFVVGGFAACLFTDFVIASVSLQDSQLHYVFNTGIFFIAAPGYVLVIYSTYLLFSAYRTAETAAQKNRLRYLLLGLAMVILGSLVNWTPLGRYPLDILANGVTAVLISYAILRHQLLDISLVIRKGLLYSLPTALIGVTYYLLISIAVSVFHTSSGTQIALISMLVAALTAILVQPLRDRAQSWVDKLFFREKYDSALMLQRISRTAASVLDLDRLSHMILAEVCATLHLQRAAILLRRQETDDFILTAHQGLGSAPTLKMNIRHPVVIALTQYDHALSRPELEVLPQFKALWGQEREELQRLGAELFIPLKAKGELVGIFAVGPKLSEQDYSLDDQRTLTTLGNQTAVAIENARLYSAEQSRREELDALFNFSRQLAATDELDTVLDIIATHAVKIVHVTFSRILTVEEDCSLLCRAAYPIRELRYDLGMGRIEGEDIQRFYQSVLDQSETMVIYHDQLLQQKQNQLAGLFKDNISSLCFTPLILRGKAIGLLILGEMRRPPREVFDAEKLRLVNAVADQAASALHRAQLHGQMEDNFVQTVLALANAMDARDTYTKNHSQRLATIAEAICRQLSCTEIEIQAIRWGALLHDIGKMAVPDHILRKPGPLTQEEWVIMKSHPEIGAKIIAPIKKLAHVAPIIRSHQEKFNGTGYPDGLKGDAIPIGARVLAVVDAYGAMTDERVYRRTLTHDEAISEINRCSGSQFDPRVVQAFMEVLGNGFDIPLPETDELADRGAFD